MFASLNNVGKSVRSTLTLCAVAALAVTTVAGSAADAGNDYRVRARIRTGTALEGKGDYRERIIGSTLIQRWSVEVGGATPGASYEVRLNGNPVGTIVANSLGRAQQEFRTVVVDDNPNDEEGPLPQDFPHINSGDTLTIVGIGTGTFVAR